jgi:hypothetical protein
MKMRKLKTNNFCARCVATSALPPEVEISRFISQSRSPIYKDPCDLTLEGVTVPWDRLYLESLSQFPLKYHNEFWHLISEPTYQIVDYDLAKI